MARERERESSPRLHLESSCLHREILLCCLLILSCKNCTSLWALPTSSDMRLKASSFSLRAFFSSSRASSLCLRAFFISSRASSLSLRASSFSLSATAFCLSRTAFCTSAANARILLATFTLCRVWQTVANYSAKSMHEQELLDMQSVGFLRSICTGTVLGDSRSNRLEYDRAAYLLLQLFCFLNLSRSRLLSRLPIALLSARQPTPFLSPP